MIRLAMPLGPRRLASDNPYRLHYGWRFAGLLVRLLTSKPSLGDNTHWFLGYYPRPMNYVRFFNRVRSVIKRERLKIENSLAFWPY
jgi:hypothetical protein